MGLYFPVNPPMKQDILPHKNVCPMAFYPLNYENRYHPCFRLWIHSRSAAAPKANSQSTRLSDTQNQQGFVGTPLIMHSSVLTTGKGFIRTCWIFCLFCLNLFIFNGRIIKKKNNNIVLVSPYINMDQPQVYICSPLPGCYRALVWVPWVIQRVPWVIQQIPIGYLFSIW